MAIVAIYTQYNHIVEVRIFAGCYFRLDIVYRHAWYGSKGFTVLVMLSRSESQYIKVSKKHNDIQVIFST